MERIKKAYAENGDLKIIPDTPPLDGSENWEQGRGAYYELDNDPNTGDPLALDIDREQDNYFKNVISKNIKHWQENSYPIYFEDIEYPKNAIVKYTNGNIYVSKVANNTALPTNTTNWSIYDPSGFDSKFVKLTGNETIDGVKTFSSFPVTPSSAPTANYQIPNKKYVDDIITAINRVGLIDFGYEVRPYHLIAFGGTFKRGDYPLLWNWLQGKSWLKTEAQWQTESTANGGICGFYSSGDGTTTFRVPNLNKITPKFDSRTIGSFESDAIRNITGSFSSGIGSTVGAFSSASGVFSLGSGNYSNFAEGSGPANRSQIVQINASLQVPTSSRVQVENIAVLPLIVAK